jgi:hypothetical protein
LDSIAQAHFIPQEANPRNQPTANNQPFPGQGFSMISSSFLICKCSLYVFRSLYNFYFYFRTRKKMYWRDAEEKRQDWRIEGEV